MKIIGKIETIDLTLTKEPSGEKETIKGGEYNVVNIEKFPNGVKVYITDKEVKAGKPLCIVEDLVKTYTPILEGENK